MWLACLTRGKGAMSVDLAAAGGVPLPLGGHQGHLERRLPGQQVLLLVHALPALLPWALVMPCPVAALC